MIKRWIWLACLPLASGCMPLNEARYDDVVRMPGEISALKVKTNSLEHRVMALKVTSDEMRAHMNDSASHGQARVVKPTKVKAPARVDRPVGGKIPVRPDFKVTLQENVLFASGSTDISRAGRLELAKVAQDLRKLSRHSQIHIVGHSDTVQPGKTLQKRFVDNWELSAARAAAVARVLAWGEGLNPAMLHVEGRAYYDPVADNRTAEGRKKNRRITIFVQSGK